MTRAPIIRAIALAACVAMNGSFSRADETPPSAASPPSPADGPASGAIKTQVFSFATDSGGQQQTQSFCLANGQVLSKVIDVNYTTTGLSPTVQALPDFGSNCIRINATFSARSVCTTVPEERWIQGPLNIKIPMTSFRNVCNVVPAVLTATVRYSLAEGGAQAPGSTPPPP